MHGRSSLRNSTPVPGQRIAAAPGRQGLARMMLLKGVVSPALRRRAEEVASYLSCPRHRDPIAIEYGGLARITSNWRRRSPSMCCGAARVSPRMIWKSSTPCRKRFRPGRRSRLVHGASPNMPAADRGWPTQLPQGRLDSHADILRRLAHVTPVRALGIWKRWFRRTRHRTGRHPSRPAPHGIPRPQTSEMRLKNSSGR